MTRYAIGKATRHYQFDIVNRPPYSRIEGDLESKLRSSVYDTLEDAQQACDRARAYNPVGFVVLILDD